MVLILEGALILAQSNYSSRAADRRGELTPLAPNMFRLANAWALLPEEAFDCKSIISQGFGTNKMKCAPLELSHIPLRSNEVA